MMLTVGRVLLAYDECRSRYVETVSFFFVRTRFRTSRDSSTILSLPHECLEDKFAFFFCISYVIDKYLRLPADMATTFSLCYPVVLVH